MSAPKRLLRRKVTQKYVLLVSHQNSTEITGMCFQKMNLRSKICFLAHKMTILSDRGPKTRCQAAHWAPTTNPYSTYSPLPQNMGKLWSHWVRYIWAQPNPTHGCYVIESDFMHDLVKFGHFCGGIVTKIGIGAKKGKNCILLWVQRYKKKLCQPSDPEVLRRLLNEVEEGKFTLKKWKIAIFRPP